MLPINLQHWLTVSNNPDNLHIYLNYYKTTNQSILSALLIMTCLRLLVLDLLHLVPLDILQLPSGTLYQSISAMCVTLSLLLNVDWRHPFIIKLLPSSNRISAPTNSICYIWHVISFLLTYLLAYLQQWSHVQWNCLTRWIPQPDTAWLTYIDLPAVSKWWPWQTTLERDIPVCSAAVAVCTGENLPTNIHR